jgi:hypothetical protein
MMMQWVSGTQSVAIGFADAAESDRIVDRAKMVKPYLAN